MSWRPRSAGPLAAAGLVAVFAATIFVALKISAPAPPTSPDLGDLAALYYPLMRYGFGELSAGHLPLWNPYQSCGEPLLANPSIGFGYPFYLPFLFLNALVALHLDVVLHLALAATAMWALCRYAGMAWWPAAIAGIVYAYHGSMLFKVNYPSFLAAVAWIPLIVLFAHRIMVNPRWRDCGWLAIVSALSLLGGYLQFTYFTVWALVPLLALQAAANVRRAGPASVLRPFGLLAIAAVVAAATALIRLWPGAEFMRDTWRPPGSLDIASSAVMAIQPRHFLSFVLTPLGEATRYTHGLSESYVGILPLGLAFAGVLAWPRRGFALGIAAAGVAAVLYAFGANGVLFPIVFALPGGNWFRAPDRALVIFGFAVAFLCGAGLDPLFSDVAPSRARRLLTPLAVVVVGVLAVLIGQRAALTGALLAASCGVALLIALLGARTRPRLRAVAGALLGLFIFIDLVAAQHHVRLLPANADAYFGRNDDFFDLIRARQGLDRTYIWAGASPDSGLYFFSDVAAAGLYHRVFSTTSYAGGIAGRRLEEFMGLLGPSGVMPFGHLVFKINAANAQLLRLMGVRFLLLEDGQQSAVMSAEILAGLHEVRRARGIVLYEDPLVFPRAFIVPQIEAVPDTAELLRRLPQTDLRRVALVENQVEPMPDQPADAQGTAATITQYTPNAVSIETSAAHAGLLVLTDQYRPGWRATLDGAPATIHRADYLFRGVRVPAGAHRVELRYRPRSFLLGAIGSVLGLMSMGLLFWWARRSRRN